MSLRLFGADFLPRDERIVDGSDGAMLIITVNFA